MAASKWLQTKLGWIWLDHYVDVRHLRQLDSSTFRPPNLWRFWSGPEMVKLHEIPRVFSDEKNQILEKKKSFQKKKKLHFMTLCISASISALWFAIGFATLNLNFAKSRWLRDAKRLRQKVNEVPGA